MKERHDKAIEDLQRAQIEWAKKRQERLDYINYEIAKEHMAERRSMTGIGAFLWYSDK